VQVRWCVEPRDVAKWSLSDSMRRESVWRRMESEWMAERNCAPHAGRKMKMTRMKQRVRVMQE
jgi:hypothetical protein